MCIRDRVLRTCGLVHAHPAGIAPFLGGDACGGVYMVNGDSKSGAVVVGIFRDHLGQVQTLSLIHI